MRKSFVALLLLLGALATLATAAYAVVSGDDQPGFSDGIAKLRPLGETSRAAKLRGQADGDTTYVGYNPAFGGVNNYWNVGVGKYWPFAGSNNARRGYWDWDATVHGDSMQGWWPIRHLYSSGTSMPTDDRLRPWYALSFGNQANYSGILGMGSPRRTFGVVGVWHADPGNVVSSFQAGTNPTAPGWAPLSGSRSAWCGFRGHGDRTAPDSPGGTSNYITSECVPIIYEVGIGTSGGGTGRLFPGYTSMMDQFLYRDISLASLGSNNLYVRFKLNTAMSTNFGTVANTRVGWTQFDQSSMANGIANDPVKSNFISSTVAGANAPRDSFTVYVGKPVDPVVGTNNDYVNAAGVARDIQDPLRREFSEIVKVDGNAPAGRFSQIYASVGDFNGTITCGAHHDSLTGFGGTARLVFRVHTNRGFDDEGGSVTGSYNSGYSGAAAVDDVEYKFDTTDAGGSWTMLGTFESGDAAGQNIDNTNSVTASTWRSTGKPPGVYPHVANVLEIGYTDLCGNPGNENRTCNMLGNVVSMGEYPGENKGGSPGTVDFERWDSILSPTILLAASGGISGTTPNSQGVTGQMADATEDWYTEYDLNTAALDNLTEGCAVQEGIQCYPASQEDGSVCWSDWQRGPFIGFESLDLCQTYISLGGKTWGLVFTSNASGIPDSVKVLLRKLTYCYRYSATICGDATKAFAYDNVAFTMIDGGGSAPLTTNFWQWMQDAFPANEDPGLPGTAAFDTCAAWVQNGLNTSIRTTNVFRHDVAGDTSAISVNGNNVRLDVVFRILPGPGNYSSVGTKSSGLRRKPTASLPKIATTDSSFWTSYINNNGTYGTAGGHPAGTFENRWSELVWNSARCDTVDAIQARVNSRQFGQVADGGGIWCSMYHEDELAGARAKLAVLRDQCFLEDTAGVLQAPNINCNRAVEGFGAYPPAWVAAVEAITPGYTGYPAGWINGSNTKTDEGTKIFPDGVFTPGTHIQYFFRREDLNTSQVDMMPDTNLVLQPGAGGDTDGKRWQTFSVLPDAWKKYSYLGSLGEACMLYVDWIDGRGNERIWVSAADSIGATSSLKFGGHNGWHAMGGADVDDAAGFVRNLNTQAGTSWDKYDFKAGEAGGDPSGPIGARESNREPVGLEAGKDARNAPTQKMLDQYSMLFITFGTSNSENIGPFSNRSADDKKVLNRYLKNGTLSDVRGLFIMGDGFLESIDPGAGLEPDVQALLAADLNAGGDYRALASDPLNGCPDMTILSPITSNGDVYGFNNSCLATLDVLTAAAGGVAATEYPDNLVSGVMHSPTSTDHWISLVTGYKINDLRSRFCGSSFGRLRFLFDVMEKFENVIGITCVLTGDPLATLDTPHTGNAGPALVDFMALKNNPLVSGSAIVSFGLAKTDRVTVKVYDVSGRLVRTLADKQLFQAGPWELKWDGTDNAGRQVSRGVYFSALETAGGKRFQQKMTVLK